MSENKQVQAFAIPQAPAIADDEFASMNSGSYLARLSLLTANSEDVKSGEASANTYRYESGDIKKELGKTVDVVPIAVRFTAVLTDDGEGNLVSVHTQTPSKDEMFQRIKQISDSQGFGSGAMYGPEFLLWIPSIGKFAAFFCNNKTARNMAGSIRELIGNAATMGSKKFDNKKFVWFGPTIVASNVPVTNAPEQDALEAVTNAFFNAKGSDLEAASEAEEGSNREV